MAWLSLFKNVDTKDSSDYVLRPSDYKNFRGWQDRCRKHNIQVVKYTVEVELAICETHHLPILGIKYSPEPRGKVYYDDYYCKIGRGCIYNHNQVKQVPNVFLVAPGCPTTLEFIKEQLPKPHNFKWL
jgi:hypothetical protein